MKVVAKKAKPAPGRPKDLGKRDDIVQAASNLFMSEGFARTSMEAVARKADVSKLTIYSHFANKDDLFREVIRRRCDKLAMPDCYAALAAQKPADGLTELGHKFVDMVFSTNSVRMHRVILAEAPHNPQIANIFYEAGPKRVRVAFGELLAEWQKQGKLVISDIEKASEQFFSLMKGELLMRVVLGRAATPDTATLHKHVDAAVAMFVAFYQPKK